ncbi:hypothetical protein FTUN_8840 [Frigoriglobus tundricola]|uniref:Uncharacterized protein n=1 Tax=Frigoriglobus tundricola TaxID=2774151 RepID=A0A6M5Z767_9BACT|nr:hypothetical protein FTUN_8840 [Frigoriglobus tundricola]
MFATRRRPLPAPAGHKEKAEPAPLNGTGRGNFPGPQCSSLRPLIDLNSVEDRAALGNTSPYRHSTWARRRTGTAQRLQH